MRLDNGAFGRLGLAIGIMAGFSLVMMADRQDIGFGIVTLIMVGGFTAFVVMWR